MSHNQGIQKPSDDGGRYLSPSEARILAPQSRFPEAFAPLVSVSKARINSPWRSEIISSSAAQIPQTAYIKPSITIGRNRQYRAAFSARTISYTSTAESMANYCDETREPLETHVDIRGRPTRDPRDAPGGIYNSCLHTVAPRPNAPPISYQRTDTTLRRITTRSKPTMPHRPYTRGPR